MWGGNGRVVQQYRTFDDCIKSDTRELRVGALSTRPCITATEAAASTIATAAAAASQRRGLVL